MNKESKYVVIYMGIIITLSIWSLSLVGAFKLPNYLLYDSFVKLSPLKQSASKKTILIELTSEQEKSANKVWITLLNELDTVGARQIIFSFFPSGASGEFYDKAVSMGNVIFGRQKLGEKEREGDHLFEPIPPQAQDKKIITAPYDLPPSNYGVHRFETAYFEINKAKTPNFLVVAAAMRNGTELSIDYQFSVNFIATTEKFPNIDFKGVLSGNMVTELVRDRSVILGLKKAKNSFGIQTPIHSDVNSISLVEYNGYAFDTLIDQKMIKWPIPLITVLFIILVAFGGLIAYPLLGETIALMVAGLFFILSIMSSWLALSYALLWPPLFEILVTEVIVLVFIFSRKYALKNSLAKEMILTKSIQIKERFSPTGFYESKEYWSRIINMINHTLNLERVIFLDKVKNDHRVKEIIALNTSIDGIKEQRRDYEREPYSNAIIENNPIQINSYFKSVKETDQQYMVPLLFEGQVQGFWAFVISPSQIEDISSLLPTIKRFAVEIGEILYKRDKWRLEQAGQKKLINKVLRLEAKEDLYQKVNNIISMLGHRLSILDLVFNSIESAIIVYDIFGQVTHVNQGMSNILKTMNITSFKMSALDLAVQLTDHSVLEMRTMFSQTIVHHDILSLPVTIPNQKKSFLLSIRPLIGEEKSFNQDEAYPFDLHGMFFEMIDVTDIKNSSTLKSDLFDRSNAHLKDGVESITNVCMMLEDDQMIGEQKKELISILNVKKDGILNFIDELNDYMKKDVFSGSYQLFPVSALKIINDSIPPLKEVADKRSITFDVMPKNIIESVLAKPGDLKKLFASMISILLQDAYDETVIHIKIEIREHHILYSLYNSGYGMPDEDFQRYLSSHHLSSSKAYKAINQIYPKIALWKGDLTGKSDVGKGIEFHLLLNKFE